MDMISPVTPPKGVADIEVFREQRAKTAYESFEAMFLQVMLKEMRKTIPDEGGIFPKSAATETFDEMLDAAFAQVMAESGQLGIAKQLEAEAERKEAAAAAALERNLAKGGLEPLKPGVFSADNP
jgi:flagellar protein FlgJ